MKVRKLAVALALAGGLGSGLAQALGMGEGRILTNLNEPLRAEIELSEPGDLSADQIQVSLAPESAFERAGLRRMDVLHDLDFDVTETDGGFRINVTSEDPIREPFLNFLVELTWPNGRLLREYSFLVDPPSRDPGQEAIGPTAGTGEGDTRTRDQAEPEPRSERRQPQSATTASGGAPDEYGPTGANDTLWGIAGEVSPSSDLSRHQVMLAIQEANPNAFSNNNINQLRRGQVLRIPDEEAIRSRSRQEAIQQVRAQNERHQQASQDRTATASAPEAEQADGADQSRQQASAGAQQPSSGESGDELRILVADGENSDGDGTMAGMGDGEGDERLAAALEELDRAERDREELASRLEDLEEQLNTMSQLIELKDDQLAEMEQRLAEARESDQATGDGESETTGGDDVAADDTAEAESEQPSGETGTAEGDSGENAVASEASTDGSMAEEGTAGSGSGEATATDDEESDPAAAAGSGGEPEDGDTTAQPDPEQTQDQGTPTSAGDVVQRVINDPRYQIGAGVLGIALLALLWGLARRNAAREQAFYDQLKDVSETPEEPVEAEETLDLDAAGDEPGAQAAGEEAAARSEGSEDALAEADVYLAYGRHEQAARHLEEAISSEPSRVDLRLKLLGVYADAGESENFEKQYRELSAFSDDEAIEQADSLRGRLDAAGEDLSIEDLTEQLKTGTGSEVEAGGESLADEQPLEDDGFDFSALEDVDDLLEESGNTEAGGSGGDQDFQSEEFSLDFDLGEEETPGEPEATGAAEEGTETGGASGSEEDVADLGFSMDDLELEEPEQPEEVSVPELDAEAEAAEELVAETRDASEQPGETDTELSLDDLDLDTEIGEEPAETPTESASDDVPSGTDFDDSFLEELDAELDRVTDGEADGTETAAQEGDDELDDLSLDVSDEDLELAEEVAQEGVGEEPEAPGDISDFSGGGEDAPADQLEESLMDSEMEDLGAESALSEEELAALEGEESQASEGDQEEAGDMESGDTSTGSEDGDDEFDFLEGTDEAGTKLDLARAYVEMGDADGARDILEEVAREGSEQQQQEAQRLLSEL